MTFIYQLMELSVGCSPSSPSIYTELHVWPSMAKRAMARALCMPLPYPLSLLLLPRELSGCPAASDAPVVGRCVLVPLGARFVSHWDTNVLKHYVASGKHAMAAERREPPPGQG